MLTGLLAIALLPACSATPPAACRPIGQSCGPSESCCEELTCTGGSCQMRTPSPPHGDDAGVPDGGGGRGDAGAPICGNKMCEPGESAETCCVDCACPSGYSCNAKSCVRDGSTCGNTLCELGETQTSCCVDCGCPSGMTCSGGSCQGPPPEVCGNGRCGAGETPDNCCADCGCPTGLACERAKCRVPGTSDLLWTVNSSVYSQNIDYRFFDQTRNLVWPGPTTYWSISGGGSATWRLTCYTGDNICFGGTGHSVTTRYWGVGLNGDKYCANCCMKCTDGATSITLTP